MALVKNNAARIFNVSTRTEKGNVVLVRLAPGLNSVDDAYWKALIKKDACSYLQRLIKGKTVQHGKEVEEEADELDATEAMSKTTDAPGGGDE